MKSMTNIDAFGHVRGESLFIDDIIVKIPCLRLFLILQKLMVK